MLPEKYFGAALILKALPSQSVCLRRQVGCVITSSGGMILSTGINGRFLGLYPHTCLNIPRECGCIHAEVDAVLVMRYHTRYQPDAAICTAAPCLPCYHLLLRIGVTKFYWAEPSDPGLKTLDEIKTNGHPNITWEQFSWDAIPQKVN